MSAVTRLLFAGLLVPSPAVAADNGEDRTLGVAAITPGDVPLLNERRVALVIGNSAYTHVGRLENAGRDARLVASTLRDIGFDVYEHQDLDKAGLGRAMVDFQTQLEGATVGLFYYSGHGLQVGGLNYIVPVDADIPGVRYVASDTVDLNEVLESMSASGAPRLNLLILDACRNNPFASQWKADGRSTTVRSGLATVNAQDNFIIAYATSPDAVATDSGAYAAALTNSLTVPCREISKVFEHVNARVRDATEGDQVPWYSSSRLPGNFYPTAPQGAVACEDGSTILERTEWPAPGIAWLGGGLAATGTATAITGFAVEDSSASRFSAGLGLGGGLGGAAMGLIGAVSMPQQQRRRSLRWWGLGLAVGGVALASVSGSADALNEADYDPATTTTEDYEASVQRDLLTDLGLGMGAGFAASGLTMATASLARWDAPIAMNAGVTLASIDLRLIW